jgi:transmembrane sensor
MESTEKNFDNLIIRHLCKETSEEENLMINLYMKNNSNFKRAYKETQLIWENSTLTSLNAEKDWQIIRNRIGFDHKKRSPFAFFLKAAAVITLFLGISSGLWVYWNVPGYGRWVVFETGAISDSIVLPDQSVVFLNKNSSLKFRNAFSGEERAVALKGEGFFDVTADKEKPFKVDIGAVSVKVVGTAFHLNGSRNDGIVELNVTQGSVLFSNKKEERSVKQGEWAIAGNRVIGKGAITNSNFMSWKTGYLEFNNSTLNEITKALNSHFSEIEKVIIKSQSDILVTTRFKGQSLEDITEELSMHFQKNFTFSNGTLVISD